MNLILILRQKFSHVHKVFYTLAIYGEAYIATIRFVCNFLRIAPNYFLCVMHLPEHETNSSEKLCLSVGVCLSACVCLSGFPTHSHSVNPHPNMFLIVVATTNLVKRIIRSFHSGFFRKIFTSLIFYIFRLKKGMLFISDLSSTGLSL